MKIRNGFKTAKQWRRRFTCGLHRYTLLAAICLPLLGGCGGREYDAVPVSGQVTLNGKPMPNAYVSFQPIASGSTNANPGPGSFGITDTDGRFTLQTIDPGYDGAVVGKHIVRISTVNLQDDPLDDSGTPLDTVFPAQCRDGSLRFEVPPGGADQADVNLTSK